MLIIAGVLGVIQTADAGALTNSFIANVKPNVEFLGRSSKLALAKSKNAKIKRFAELMANRQAIAANSLTAWWQANTAEGSAAALGTTDRSVVDLDPLGLVKKPAPSQEKNAEEPPLNTDVPILSTRMPASMPSNLLPAQEADYRSLMETNGPAFDKFYAVAERNSLRQLAALYRDYAAQGDDPALRSISEVQLPRVNDAIRQLNEVR